jgi:hypothetical protein
VALKAVAAAALKWDAWVPLLVTERWAREERDSEAVNRMERISIMSEVPNANFTSRGETHSWRYMPASRKRWRRRILLIRSFVCWRRWHSTGRGRSRDSLQIAEGVSICWRFDGK